MARRSEHSQEQIKEMVLKAAENIIVDEGVEALTVRKIAMEIGYTVGSIYMVFANMQDLMTHIKGRTLDALAMQMQNILPAAETEQKIAELANIYLKFAVDNYNRWSIIFEPNLQHGDAIPDWYRQKVDQMFAPIEALFKQLRPEIGSGSAQQSARILWCGVHGVCVLSLTGNLGRAGVESAEAAVRSLVENFIRGWKAR